MAEAVIACLILLVAALVALTAWLRRDASPFEVEQDDPDHHTLHSDYQSGVGGGAVTTWKVPKDPDAYAKFFVPRGSHSGKGTGTDTGTD